MRRVTFGKFLEAKKMSSLFKICVKFYISRRNTIKNRLYNPVKFQRETVNYHSQKSISLSIYGSIALVDLGSFFILLIYNSR
jgi:hypothetical protein